MVWRPVISTSAAWTIASHRSNPCPHPRQVIDPEGMDLVSLLIVLIVVGAVVYVAGILPIDNTIKTIIKVVAVVALVVYLLRAFAPSLNLG